MFLKSNKGKPEKFEITRLSLSHVTATTARLLGLAAQDIKNVPLAHLDVAQVMPL